MDSNPTICEEKLTSNPNRKWGFIEKQSWHYSVSVLLNHHQDYEGYILNIINITSHSPDDGSAEPKHYSVNFVSL